MKALMIFTFGLIGTGFFHAMSPNPAIGQVTRTVSVTGTGTVTAKPDVAEINLGVVSQDSTARGALSANNKAMADLQEELKRRRVAEKDIQTTQIVLTPRYSVQRNRVGVDQETGRKIIGYTVTNSVRVTVREIEGLGEILDSVVSAGANQMNGITFRIEESKKLLDEARQSALADAKDKASQLTEGSGLRLGLPTQISESSRGTPQPVFSRSLAMTSSAEVPVAPGQQELQISIQVTYEMLAVE